jgi:ligand-binding sensor domain-containing protein
VKGRRQETGDRRQKTLRVTRWFIFCLLTSVSCLLLSHLVHSQSTEEAEPAKPQPVGLHQWGAVTLFHGLPSDRVRAVAQDSDGAMWFGTDAGLAKYDGRRTQTITNDALPQGRVLALKIDADGALWVGTEGGATRYSNNQFHLIKETEGKAVTSIITPERGRAILASDEGLIFNCALDASGAINVQAIPNVPLRSADEEHPGPLRLTSLALANGMLYAGTRSRGLLNVEGEAVREVQSRPRPFFIEAVETDAQGHLWLGARVKGLEGALYEASDPLHPKLIDGATGAVTSLGTDGRGDMWVGTEGRGVFQYRGAERIAHFTFDGTAGGLRSDSIYAIFVDREDVVWFGTDRGVCRYDPYALRVETISDNPESNFVRALLQARDGRLFCGTNRGLFVRDVATRAWRSVNELAQKTVYTITADTDGRLLVGSASGLYLSDDPVDEKNQTLHFTHQDSGGGAQGAGDSIRAIARFQGQTYLATFGRGLERLDGERRTLVWPTGPQDARVREVVSLYADENNRLWIGTATSGAYLFDGKMVKSDPVLNELADSAVWSVDGTQDGLLWFATTRGLYSYFQGGLKKVLPETEARRVMISGSRASSRQVWCATAGSGLVKLSLDQRFGAMTAHLDAEQGLPSPNVFALLQDESDAGGGALLIGTSRGLARYDPGRASPILSITRLIGQRIHTLDEVRDGLALEYPQNSLVLDVSATSSRTFPEQFQYAFLLYNNQGEVIKQKLAHDAQFSMEDLRPGKYRVEVRAYTADLIPSAPLGFEFNVAKAPFPWTTAALSALLLLALVALIWAIIEHRRIAHAGAALALANHELADARLRLANEAETERSRIARDLHDQTLADLRRLLLLTDKLPVEGKENGDHAPLDPAIFRQEIESVSNEIRRICEDLSPSVLENVGLAAALEWALADAVAHLPESCKFEYEFACEEDLEDRISVAPGVRMQIYRIVQEAISNICRHAAAHRVRLDVSLTNENELILKLTDDGGGFDQRDKKAGRGRGLANIRARASLIEAEVAWSRNPHGGTLFTLRKANIAARLEQQVS